MKGAKMGRVHVSRLIAGAIFCLTLAACNRKPAYRFEGQPRALLQDKFASLWDPQLGVSTSGTLYLLGMYDTEDVKPRLGFTMSHDGGDTFMPMIPVSRPIASITSHGEASPRLADGGTVLYALWAETSDEGDSRLLLARSLSYGHSFEQPIEITHQTSFASFASLGVLPDNGVLAVWLDGRDGKPNSETFSVYAAKSTDQGASFGQNFRIASGACPCCRPSVTADPNGKIFIGWRKVFAGEIRDMVVSTSSDGGSNFSEPVRVTDDGWNIKGCPDSGPSLAVLDGRLFAAWMTEGREQRPRIRLAWSGDGAKSFSKPEDISGYVLDPNHPALKTTADGKLIVIFQGREPQGTGSWRKSQAYVVEVNITGRASAPMPLPGSAESASYPTVAPGTGHRLFAAWTQPRGDAQATMLSRGRSAE
jgi:hypothetical protein